MKVLYFSIVPFSFDDDKIGFKGASWIASLIRVMSSIKDFHIAVSYVNLNNGDIAIQQRGNISIYPINIHRNKIQKLKDHTKSVYFDNIVVEESLNIIKKYQPDIIHVFGSEWNFGLITPYTNIPVVIHMQGFWPQYRNVNLLKSEFALRTLKVLPKTPKQLLSNYRFSSMSKQRADREENILRLNKYFFGRTEWDRSIVYLYNTKACYFHVNEALRDEFVENKKVWHPHDRSIMKLVSVGTSEMKGMDVILKTAQLIKENFQGSFVWTVFGKKPNLKYLRTITGIVAQDVYVHFVGNGTAEEIMFALLDADMYVHAAYAENSPNSICEAQMMGMPIISSNAGGIISLFDKEYNSSMLAPINDPFYLASKIIQLANDKELCVNLGKLNWNISRSRNNDENIRKETLNAYDTIISNHKV